MIKELMCPAIGCKFDWEFFGWKMLQVWYFSYKILNSSSRFFTEIVFRKFDCFHLPLPGLNGRLDRCAGSVETLFWRNFEEISIGHYFIKLLTAISFHNRMQTWKKIEYWEVGRLFAFPTSCQAWCEATLNHLFRLQNWRDASTSVWCKTCPYFWVV